MSVGHKEILESSVSWNLREEYRVRKERVRGAVECCLEVK